MTARKTTTKASAAKKTKTVSKAAAPKRASAPRRTAKHIRNLRGTLVHLRLYSQNAEKPFRIELKPRGVQGDTSVIPANLIDDPTFLAAVDVLVEVITESEHKALQGTYAPVGYLGRQDAPKIIRPDDTTIMKAKDWDGEGRRVPQEREIQRVERGSDVPERAFGTGMHTIDLPGSDTGLHALLAEGNKALPPEADFGRQQRVVVERVKES